MKRKELSLKEVLKKDKEAAKIIKVLSGQKSTLEKKLSSLDRKIKNNQIELYKMRLERVVLNTRLDRIFDKIFKVAGVNHF